MNTVVLNADYTYLNTVPWQRAIKLLVKEKAEAIKEADRQICNAEGTCVLKIPLVLRLVQMVQTVYRNKVPYSRKNVFVRDNHTCQYCGTHEDLSIDHVQPRSRGGKTSFENCVASCVKCNVHKGDRTPAEANMVLRKHPHEPTIIEFLTHKMKHTGVYSFLKEIKIYS
jgi:5-methylcytosine-specific restriction endonuclease McrA